MEDETEVEVTPAHLAEHLAELARVLEDKPAFLTLTECSDLTGISKSKITQQAQDPRDPMPSFLRPPGASIWRVPKTAFLKWLTLWSAEQAPAELPAVDVHKPAPLFEGPEEEDDDGDWAGL